MIGIIFASLLLGMFSGVLAGLFGIGGGMVIVPVLVFLFTAQGLPADLVMIMAIATSLATIILTASSSVLAHHRLGSVLWDKVFRLAPGMMLGAILGAVVAHQLHAGVLRTIFIVFLLYVGTQMALETKFKAGEANYSKLIDFLVAGAIGLISSLVGIGGGTLTVPFLVHCRYPMRNAVAIASACCLPIAVASSLSYMVLGLNTPNLPAWSYGYVYVPSFFGVSLGSIFTAPIGANLAHKLPSQQLKRYFSVLIFILAIKLMWY
ncbi:sulfite exporter TauE/SafE family protein [Methyloglobulus sp.]|uniref:sulfite exporter TauE/SafE family protein n=1 Tax=Methyloglobulus sp. TaxID=2518622 RepID=UPI003989CD50